MKILTKEEEQAHYNATVKGGSIGGAVGLAIVRPSSSITKPMYMLTFSRAEQPHSQPMPVSMVSEASHFP